MNNVKIVVKLKSDTGTIKINVWASSLDAAKEIVCNAQKAPLNAVICAKVAALTIYDIKRLSEEKAPYFFNIRTMKSFNQTLKSFKVSRLGNDKFYIYAPSFGGNKTERIFNPFTNELEHIQNKY